MPGPRARFVKEPMETAMPRVLARAQVIWTLAP